MSPGSSTKLDILRKSQQKTITVTLATMPSRPEKQAKALEPESRLTRGVPHLGLSVAPASGVASAGNEGPVITAVDGPTAEHGLQSGDVILDVGGKGIDTAAEVRDVLSEAKSEGKRDMLMRVKTAENTHLNCNAHRLGGADLPAACCSPQRGDSLASAMFALLSATEFNCRSYSRLISLTHSQQTFSSSPILSSLIERRFVEISPSP
jgi:hypothetical protein